MKLGLAGAGLVLVARDTEHAGRSAAMARGRQQLATPTHELGRLLVRPAEPVGSGAPGLQALGLDTGRDGLLYIPNGYRADRPAPFALLLHGAGGDARHGLAPLLPLAEEAGLILLAPDSRGTTWDELLGGWGPNVAFIDRALEQTFDWHAVDPTRLAVGGFSDGASYALSVGITNGDLFGHVLAFSPGCMAPAARRDRPRLFISHGTRDQVLPVEKRSRRIVPQAQRAGDDVRYREFDGPPTVPSGIAREALDFFLAESD